MKLVKSPIWWCALFGMVIGYFGIPIVPWGYTKWEWIQPYGFHPASVFIFGVAGYLVGLFLHYGIWKRLERTVALWTVAIAGFALAIGAIGVFSHQAHNETVMWTDVNLGFVRAMAVSRDNVTNVDEGLQLTQAGADIQAGANAGGIEPFGRNQYYELGSVASAFSQAGYFIASRKDKEKWHESIRFVNRCGPILRQIGDQSYPDRTKNLDELLSKITSLIPNDFDQGWPAN